MWKKNNSGLQITTLDLKTLLEKKKKNDAKMELKFKSVPVQSNKQSQEKISKNDEMRNRF